MSDKEKSSKTNGLKRPSGPWLLMTDSEYAVVQRAAKSAGKTIAGYVRNLVLKHKLPPDIKQGTAQRLLGVGRQLNRLVRNLHIARKSDDLVLSYGRPVPGKIPHEEVTETLGILEQELSTLDLGGLVKTGGRPRGPGDRIKRGQVRCTPQELAQIQERSAVTGLSRAAFIRAVALKRPLGKISYWKTWRELYYIRHNLCQLRDMELGSTEIAKKTLRLIDWVDDEIEKLAAENGRGKLND